jgi:hypothetical protein
MRQDSYGLLIGAALTVVAMIVVAPATAHATDDAGTSVAVEDQWRSAPITEPGWPLASEKSCREYGLAYGYAECAIYGRKPSRAERSSGQIETEHAIQQDVLRIALPERRGPWTETIAPERSPVLAAAPDGGLEHQFQPVVLAEFDGATPEDAGVIAVTELIARGRIGGVVIRPENVRSDRQLAALSAHLRADGRPDDLLIAVRQIVRGPGVVVLPIGYPAYPSGQTVGADNDPERAYQAYHDIARIWNDAGVDMVIASTHPDDSVNFGSNPDHIASFLRAKLLAHRDAGVAFAPPLKSAQVAYDEALAKLSGPSEPAIVMASGVPDERWPHRLMLDLAATRSIDLARAGEWREQADIVILPAAIVQTLAQSGEAPGEFLARAQELPRLRADLGIGLRSVTSSAGVETVN